jgi:hypothetical protein
MVGAGFFVGAESETPVSLTLSAVAYVVTIILSVLAALAAWMREQAGVRW